LEIAYCRIRFVLVAGLPALLQQKINASGLPYQMINAGVNGDTSARGVQRIEQYLHQPIDVFLLELGINDLPRGIFRLRRQLTCSRS
jgi:acyl-CoA thioesterase-1